MFDKTLEPCELIIEFGSRPGVSIRKIQAANQDSVDSSLDVTALAWIRIAGQAAPRLVDFADPA